MATAESPTPAIEPGVNVSRGPRLSPDPPASAQEPIHQCQLLRQADPL